MSGPKALDYRAVERHRAESARRRWLAIGGRVEALNEQCVSSGYPECAVVIGTLSDTSSAELERLCDELEAELTSATENLARRKFADRTRQVAANLKDVLAELERREQRPPDQASQRSESATHRSRTSSETKRRSAELAAKVARLLTSLQSPSAELEQAAHAVLTETDPDRSRLLYQDLSERIALANARDAERARYLTEIAELRAQAESVSDPAPLRALLDHAELIATSGGSADIDLRQAKAAITEQLDAAAAAADRDYVRNAVAESLLELGYETADVDLETPETLVFRQSNSHGVRADVRNGRIDIRAVRLGPIARGDAGSADRDAEDEFCNRIPILLSALRDRGVSADVAERRLPGLSTPETLSLRSDPDRSSSAGERPNKRSRTAR